MLETGFSIRANGYDQIAVGCNVRQRIKFGRCIGTHRLVGKLQIFKIAELIVAASIIREGANNATKLDQLIISQYPAKHRRINSTIAVEDIVQAVAFDRVIAAAADRILDPGVVGDAEIVGHAV